MQSFRYLLLFLSTCLALSISVPEKVELTNFPNQAQSIFQGWLSVDDQIQGYLYYQLFLAANPSVPSKDIPVILFLEGGPGDSSTQTVWADFGPYTINSNLNLTGPNNLDEVNFTFSPSELSWANSYHLLSIDNPVLTGFSFSESGVSDNTTMQVGNHLVAFLTRFYQIYSELVGNPLYIVGHSYGGHWAPYFAYDLVRNHNLTLNGTIPVNLGGLIGMNPFVQIRKQKGYADIVFGAGLTDVKRRDALLDYEIQIDKYLKEHLLLNATNEFFDEFSYVLNLVSGQIVTPNATVDNLRRNHLLEDPDSIELTAHYLSPKYFFNLSAANLQCAKTVFSIPDGIQFLSGYVEQNFVNSGDFGFDFTYAIEYLLDNGINVTILAAQDDGTVPATGVTQLVASLNWTQQADFRSAKRNPWKASNGTVVGTFKKHQNLNYVILYKSGHVTTFDQPEVILEFLHSITQDAWEPVLPEPLLLDILSY